MFHDRRKDSSLRDFLGKKTGTIKKKELKDLIGYPRGCQ
jgi:hypothetical protein